MIAWGDFKTQIRRTILKDTTPDEETGEYRWSDEELLDSCIWALDTFSSHTAVATSTSYSLDGSNGFSLPGNLFTSESFDQTGTVWIDGGTYLTYYDPIREYQLLSIRDIESQGFYTKREDPFTFYLRIPNGIPTSGTLNVEYFAHYTRPVSDNTVIELPQWSEVAVAHLTGAYALSGSSLKTSLIRQFAADKDKGTPEHNPVRQQQQWFMEIYNCEVKRYVPQTRMTVERNDARS